MARKAEETRFVDTLRNRTSRSLTTAEREHIATIAEKKPSIDLVTRSAGRPMFPNGMGVAVIDATYPDDVTDDTLEDGEDPSVAVGWQRKRMDQCCSVRSAWEAIHVLLKRGPAPPPVYQGQYDPKALFNALKVFVSQ